MKRINPTTRRLLTGFMPALCVACLAGCNGRAALVPVEGQVTLDGRPLAGATVSLNPTRATEPGPFVGKTDVEGRFALGAVGSERGGAATGEYFLYIRTVETPPGADELTPPPTQREVVPVQYRDGSQRFEVPPGGTTEANFVMSTR